VTKILDYIVVALAIPVGFFVGLFTLLIAGLLGVSAWMVMPFVLVACAIFVFADGLLGRLMWGGVERVSKKMGVETADPEQIRKWEAWHRRAGRLAFGLGIVIAFTAAQFIEPVKIMEYF